MSDVGENTGTIIAFPKMETRAERFMRRFKEISDANVETARKKNADYASQDDPFANFEAAPLVGVSVERGMLVRMQDKMQRISNLLDRPAAVTEESILDTCDDLSNYATILRMRLEMMRENDNGDVG